MSEISTASGPTPNKHENQHYTLHSHYSGKTMLDWSRRIYIIWREDSTLIFLNSKLEEVAKSKFYHLYISLKYDFSPNLKVIAQKMSLPCPWEVWKGQGHGRLIFQATPFKFGGKLNSHEIFNWSKFGVDISKHFGLIPNWVIL